MITFDLFTLCPPQFSALYLISLVVILIGFITFNAVPTPQRDPASSSFSFCEAGFYDNSVTTLNVSIVTVRINAKDEEDGKEQQDGENKEGCEEKERNAPGPAQHFGRETSEEDAVAVWTLH